MAYAFADITFTPNVLAQQEKNGAHGMHSFLSPEREGRDRLTEREAQFIEARDGFYQSTVSETGWPYVQFKGGTPGFLKALDETTLAYADVSGNRQYLSVGNLTGNDRVSLILVDYPNARRLKLWGHVEIVERDGVEFSALATALQVPVEAPNIERVIKIRIAAFDWNCPRNIPRRYTDSEALARVAELENEAAQLREQLAQVLGPHGT